MKRVWLRRLFCAVFGHTEPDGADEVRRQSRKLVEAKRVLGEPATVRGSVACAICGTMIDMHLETL